VGVVVGVVGVVMGEVVAAAPTVVASGGEERCSQNTHRSTPPGGACFLKVLVSGSSQASPHNRTANSFGESMSSW